MNYFYKFGAILILILFFCAINPTFAQYKYCFDLQKSHVGGVWFINIFKNGKKNCLYELEITAIQKKDLKKSKKIRNHAYRIQTHEVKKRMKKSKKTAEYFNRGKVPLSVKFKSIF